MALRGTLFAFDYIAKPFSKVDPQAPPIPEVMKFDPYWSDWARWDAGWYMGMVTKGYQHVPDLTKQQSNVAFLSSLPLAGPVAECACRPREPLVCRDFPLEHFDGVRPLLLAEDRASVPRRGRVAEKPGLSPVVSQFVLVLGLLH